MEERIPLYTGDAVSRYGGGRGVLQWRRQYGLAAAQKKRVKKILQSKGWGQVRIS